MAKQDLDTFCKIKYKKEWEKTYNANITNELTEAQKESVRLMAQREAVDKTFVSALLKYYPTVNEKSIWEAIGNVHKIKIAELDKYNLTEAQQLEIYKKCISAHQSWIKTSGHSFERFISSKSKNKLLKQNEIRFILQSELTEMIKQKKLANTQADIEGLKSWGKDFDLYAIQKIHRKTYVFGCIQSKTSIRDRVGRDRQFSLNAMDGLFWSAAITLDGEFLNMPEFISMVNGGGSYETNSWHGMYALTGIKENNKRIYKTNEELDLFINHSICAARQFIADRRMLKRDWKATDIEEE